MGYAFMSIEKIKTIGAMTSKYNHNCRKVEVENAIPELAELNEDLVTLPKNADGQEVGYADAFQQRVSSLPYYQDRSIKRNQVLGYEVMLTYSRDEKVDVEKWKSQSMDWLHKTFDVAPDGKSNVLHAVFHGDETGNVHIHAFVVPVDERGHLNAKRFTGGTRTMQDLQTSYADSVKNLGIQRGIAGSSAKHQDIRRMYATLNNAMNIPEVLPGETADQYRNRIIDNAKTMFASQVRSITTQQTKRTHAADLYIQQQRQSLNEEADRIRSGLSHDVQALQKRKKELESEVYTLNENLDEYRKIVGELAAQMYEIRSALDNEEDRNEKAAQYDKLQQGLEVTSVRDPERAAEFQVELEDIISQADFYEEVYQERETTEKETAVPNIDS